MKLIGWVYENTTDFETGICSLYWWREEPHLNEEYLINKPIWEVFTSKEIVQIYLLEEIIEISEERFNEHFTKKV